MYFVSVHHALQRLFWHNSKTATNPTRFALTNVARRFDTEIAGIITIVPVLERWLCAAYPEGCKMADKSRLLTHGFDGKHCRIASVLTIVWRFESQYEQRYSGRRMALAGHPGWRNGETDLYIFFELY